MKKYKKHTNPNCQCASCKSKRGELSGKNSPNWYKLKIKCSNCNKIVFISKYLLKLKHHFCNRKCFGEWMTKYRIGEKNFNCKNRKTLQQKYFCKADCGNEISMFSALYGKGQCKSCSHKGKKSHFFGKTAPHTKYIKYKRIYFHSSWEKKYAKYLDKLGVKWLYESKTFNLGDCTYTPDFYLPATDEYIEIKGWFRPEAKNKFRLFKKLYPKINIKILMKKELQNLKVF